MHMGAKFEANYLYLSDGETLSRVKQKLEDEYPLPLRMELNKEAGTLEISCDEYGDYPVQFIWNLMNLEDFSLSNGIKHYCGYGEWTSGEMGKRYPFEVMELTEEQKKKYPDWVQQCTSKPVNQTVVGALIGKNIAQCNELPKGYCTPVKYSNHFLSFEVTLEQKEEFEQYIRRLPFGVDYAYYAYSYSDDPNDTYGPYHYQKNSKDEDVKKYIDSLDYLLEIDKFCLEYAKCQLDDMLVPCDASVLPELYEINLEEIGYEIEEYYSSSLAVLIGESIKIPSGSPLRQQIRYEFKKDDKKVIILQGVITLNVELLRYYGVQEAVYYHFKETDDDTHPRQYMIDDVPFELLQQLCEVIERHILIKKKKGWTYKNEDFLSLLDKAIDDLYLNNTQLYHKPSIKEWVYKETDNQIILARYLYNYARINIPTMYRKKQVVLDFDFYHVTHIRFKLVEDTPLLIKEIALPFSNEKLMFIDLTNSVTVQKKLPIPAEEIIGECIVVPEDK